MAIINVLNAETVKIDKSSTVYIHTSIANIRYELNEDADILIYCDVNETLQLKECGFINESNVSINYIHLDKENLIQNSKIDILRNGKLNITSTYLGTLNKKVVYDIYNKESDSELNITNNVVALDDSEFSLDCIGTIVKGAKRSKCHQKNRCLTMGNPKKATVLPVLNIDENDVEASHSLSSGTIDEEVLFYMNSRGLSKNQSLNLIIKSYLMPADSFYTRFEDGLKIQESAIRKVDELCSM